MKRQIIESISENLTDSDLENNVKKEENKKTLKKLKKEGLYTEYNETENPTEN